MNPGRAGLPSRVSPAHGSVAAHSGTSVNMLMAQGRGWHPPAWRAWPCPLPGRGRTVRGGLSRGLCGSWTRGPQNFFWRLHRLENVPALPGTRGPVDTGKAHLSPFVLPANASAACGMPALLGAENTVRRVDRGPRFPRAEQDKGQVASAVKERRGRAQGPGSSPERRCLVRGREGNK